MTEKECTKCGEVKPLDDYRLQPKGKFGRHSICRLCEAKHRNRYRAENPEKRREGDRVYREKNREKRLEQSRRYREENREYLKVRTSGAQSESQRLSLLFADRKEESWTETEDEFLLSDHGMTNFQLALHLQKTYGQTTYRKYALRKKNKEKEERV